MVGCISANNALWCYYMGRANIVYKIYVSMKFQTGYNLITDRMYISRIMCCGVIVLAEQR